MSFAGNDGREPHLWSTVKCRPVNEGLPPDSTDRWPEPMYRGEFHVPMALWNVLGRKRLMAAENVYGPLNLSQAERRELEETWTMIQTDDLSFDRYPPESRPRPPQSLALIPLSIPENDTIVSKLKDIDEDEDFFRKKNSEKGPFKELYHWLKQICCFKKKEPSVSVSKPEQRTFKVNIAQSIPPTPTGSIQGSVIAQNQPGRRLMRHSLIADNLEFCGNTDSGRSYYSSGRSLIPNEHPIFSYDPIGTSVYRPFNPSRSDEYSDYRRPSSRISSAASATHPGPVYDTREYDGALGPGSPQYGYPPGMDRRVFSSGSQPISPRELRNRAHVMRFGPHIGGRINGGITAHERFDRGPHRAYHVAHSIKEIDEDGVSNITDFTGVHPAAFANLPSPRFQSPTGTVETDKLSIAGSGGNNAPSQKSPRRSQSLGHQTPPKHQFVVVTSSDTTKSPMLELPFLKEGMNRSKTSFQSEVDKRTFHDAHSSVTTILKENNVDNHGEEGVGECKAEITMVANNGAAPQSA